MLVQTVILFSGECRNFPPCSQDEKADFPRRMREWLFNVMEELGQRRELSYHYQQMKKEAEVNNMLKTPLNYLTLK